MIISVLNSEIFDLNPIYLLIFWVFCFWPAVTIIWKENFVRDEIRSFKSFENTELLVFLSLFLYVLRINYAGIWILLLFFILIPFFHSDFFKFPFFLKTELGYAARKDYCPEIFILWISYPISSLFTFFILAAIILNPLNFSFINLLFALLFGLNSLLTLRVTEIIHRFIENREEFTRKINEIFIK